MIDKVLRAIVKDCNGFLRRRYSETKEDIASLINLTKPDGNMNDRCAETIICSMVNLEQERAHLNISTRKKSLTVPPLQMSVMVLFAANFHEYEKALQKISSIIGFFHNKQVFSPQNTPGLPNNLDKITVEMVNLSFEQLNNLWGTLGASYMPSAVFKLRMTILENDVILEEIPEISRVELPSDPGK